MTKPRSVEKGVTYLVTRRCSQRQFLLRPTEEVNAFFLFCLAYAAKQSGVLVHGYCVMANHYHVVLTDVDGKLPMFAHLLNMFVGRGVNALCGRWESFWAPGSYSAVRLVEENDLLAKLVYSLQNPVAAGLVESSRLWPGLCSRPEDMLGKQVEVSRPAHFFRKKSKVPASVTLTLSPPPGVDGDRFSASASAVLEMREEQLRAEVRAKGDRFMGAKAVMKQQPLDTPKSRERRRGLNPRVACRDKWRRIETLQRLKRFEERYWAAWSRFTSGDRETPFPVGTYWMVVVAKQPSEAAA